MTDPKWLVMMGPHRFVIQAADQEQASEYLDARLQELGLERISCEFLLQPQEGTA